MIKLPRTRAARYVAALMSLVAASGLTLFARPLFATTSYALFLAAVMFSSWYGGLTPGLIVVLLSVFALDRYFASPELSGVLSRDDVVHLGIFLLVAGLINYLSRKRIRAEEALQISHAQLELRITESTADLRRLSGQLLHLQDEERRRTARLLHETVAQDLVALKMDLAVLRRFGKWDRAEAGEALEEALALTDECIREARTVSYLLHPPLLDEAGLASALQWYIAGFERRSGIRTKLNLPPTLGRLPRETELIVFRFVQECLTNVHRHSGSPSARITINETATELVVRVSDRGCGMPQPTLDAMGSSSPLLGVGIMGMYERVKQAGGSMKIQSGHQGTIVTAVLPCQKVVLCQEHLSL
jgi:signal transduction histidine kinase